MFRNARIKLTAWYLLIIMAISLSFSAVIYRMLTFEIDRFAERQQSRIERQLEDAVIFPAPPRPADGTQFIVFDTDIMHETKQRLLIQFLLINAAIIVIAGGLGYILAGKTLRPIADMLDEQKRFISDASHELRTPLTAIKSSIEVAVRDKDMTVDTARTVLKENIDDVNTLQTLTDQLLELARLEMNGNKKLFETIDIQTIATSAVKRVAPIAKQKSITITEDLHSQTVLGDSHALTDCCVVLLDNAIKYSNKKKSITITATTQGNDALITIQDYGIGISPSDLPHIFDRFYRADAARSKSKTNGYGLGLSIAKKIAEEHNGKLLVKSALHKGSTFSLILPLHTNKKSA
ncbi:MAG: ATP-binding protein [Microgenomates group bacterium]